MAGFPWHSFRNPSNDSMMNVTDKVQGNYNFHIVRSLEDEGRPKCWGSSCGACVSCRPREARHERLSVCWFRTPGCTDALAVCPASSCNLHCKLSSACTHRSDTAQCNALQGTAARYAFNVLRPCSTARSIDRIGFERERMHAGAEGVDATKRNITSTKSQAHSIIYFVCSVIGVPGHVTMSELIAKIVAIAPACRRVIAAVSVAKERWGNRRKAGCRGVRSDEGAAPCACLRSRTPCGAGRVRSPARHRSRLAKQGMPDAES